MKKRDQGSRIANRLCGVLTGTRFLTPTGYRAVETLRRGDLVATLIGRGPTFVPIVWVGRRKMQLTSDDDPMFRCPVRIRRHAVADNMPDADLLLAPDHAIYLDARLFSTRLLINQATIVSETHRRTAEYWGIQVEQHDLLIAQNLPIESLLPVNAAPFSEVRTPYLSIVGAEETGNEAPPPASLDFPASMRMTPRWFRRRFLARSRTPVVATPSPEPAPGPLPDDVLDLGTEVRAALEALLGLAQLRGIKLEFAVEPGLTVRMDRSAFRQILRDLLTHGLYAGTVQRVLVGAMQHAGRVQVAVVTDGSPGPSREDQAHALRPIMDLVSQQGGTLEIDTRPQEGSTLLLRLPGACSLRE